MKKSAFRWLVLAVVYSGGCATVDPRSDYDRTAGYIGRATGRDESYRPGDDEAVAARVAALTNNGLTVDEAIQVSLLHNPRLQAAFLDVGVARADVVQAGLLSNPSLYSSLQLPDGGGLADVQLNIAKDIADLWLIPARKRSAEQALEQAILELARQASVLAVETKSAYYKAVSADRVAQIAAENRDIAQQLYNAAQARQQAGEGSRVEVNLSQSELMEAELAQRRASLAAYEERRTLAMLLGLKTPPGELSLLDALPSPGVWTLDLEKLAAMARRHRLDLQATDRRVDAARARWIQEQRSVFKSVELGLALEREERRSSSGGDFLANAAAASAEAGRLALPQPDSGDDGGQDTIIGPSISLELPIFDQNQAQIAKARFLYAQSVKQRESLELEVLQEIRLAYQRARTTWDVASYYRDDLLPLRTENLDLTREAYREGTESFLAVLEAQRALLRTRSSHLEALRDAAVALSDIERATGLPIKSILDAGQGTDPKDARP